MKGRYKSIKGITLFLVFLFFTRSLLFAQYHSDILGKGFESRVIQLNDDYEGKVQATLIRSLTDVKTETAVLYVHGFNDYFFQEHLAKKINDAGFHFYAIDLRKYGRSHLSNQKWCNVRDISEYYTELDKAIEILKSEGIRKIILNAHSTGGLIIANYLKDRKKNQIIVGAMLNSPFLEFNYPWVVKKIAIPIITKKSEKKINKEMDRGSNQNYGESLYKGKKGEWDYNLEWKKLLSPAVNYGWIRAIKNAQKNVRKDVNIQIPVVVFSSDKSYKKSKWDEEIRVSDAVLDVKDIQKYGKMLGDNVHIVIIKNGKHDLVLSNKQARDQYLDKLVAWVRKAENSK